MSLQPALPLSEVAEPIVTAAASGSAALRGEPPVGAAANSIPAVVQMARRAHAAGPELVMAATAVSLALTQLRHAEGRDDWSQETANLAGELEVNLLTIHQALEALAHRAATHGGQPL